MEKVVFDKKFLTIKVDLEAKLIYMEWKAFASSNDYRDGLNTALHLVKTHQLRKWLGNLKHMKAISQEDQEWTNQEWFPKMANSTLQKMAIVMSNDIFNKLAIDHIMQKAEDHVRFDIQFFNYAEFASRWLDSIEQPKAARTDHKTPVARPQR